MQEPVSTRLDLRPIPPPTPVTLPENTWWLWFIPIVLIGFLYYWWFRRVPMRQPTPEDLLIEAMNDSEQTVFTLDEGLRNYLAWRSNPLWLSTPYAEADPLWAELFTGSEQAGAWQQRFSALERDKYSEKQSDSALIQDWKQAIEELLSAVQEHDKLMKSNNSSADVTKSV
jgi:hypothetical protein